MFKLWNESWILCRVFLSIWWWDNIWGSSQMFDWFLNMRFWWESSQDLMSFVMRILWKFLYVERWTFALKKRENVAFRDDPWWADFGFSLWWCFILIFPCISFYDMPWLYLCELCMFISWPYCMFPFRVDLAVNVLLRRLVSIIVFGSCWRSDVVLFVSLYTCICGLDVIPGCEYATRKYA